MLHQIDEKTLDDEVDELKDKVEQIVFDVKQEKEERRYEANEIRVDIGRLRLEKKEWENLRALSIEMERMERDINHLIGVKWWKPYIGGVFWSNLATPLNISMSIMSLISAGQQTLSYFFSPSVTTTISFTVFMISLVNTFFTPHSRIADGMTQMNEWKLFATQYEKIYYSARTSQEEIERRYREYRDLMVSMKQHIIDNPNRQNLFEDGLYWIVNCFKKMDQWMELDQKEKI
jgi:hypothetical protein